MNKKINIAIVGLGRISIKHIDAIKKNNKYFNLIAVCDTDKAKLKKINKTFNLKTYINFNNLVKDKNINLISLCTPSGLHAKHSILASKYKKNIITEKPMATNLNDAKRMIIEANKNRVKLFVVKQNRFNPTLMYIKKLIDKNELGKIYLFHSNVFWHRSQSYYDSATWRGTKKLDGGALMNQASHYVDLIDWFFGPINFIHSFSSTLERNIEVEDTAVLNLKCKNILGSLSVTMLNYEKNYEGSLTIISEKGTIKIGGVALNSIKEINLKNKRIEEKIKNLSYNIENIYGNGHVPYYKNVAMTINNKEKASTDGYEGIKSLNLILKSYESNKKNKTLKI